MIPGARAAIAVLLLAASPGCGGDGGGGGGDGGRVTIDVDSTAGCLALGPSAFPPGLALLRGAGRGVALNFDPSLVVSFELEGEAPARASGIPDLGVPNDSDGDGIAEGTSSVPDAPRLDDVFVRDPALDAARLGLVTASGYEEVIVFDPDLGELVEVEIEVDAAFAPTDYRRLPPPGTSAARTAISTDACIRPVAPIDSNGDDYAAGFPSSVFCDPAVPGSFRSRFTSGAAVAAGRLFVSVSNLGSGGGGEDARFLPGAVLVYDVDLGSDPPWIAPNPSVPMIETFAYNPTHVTRVPAAGRELVLVTLTGAIGVAQDDPGTPEIEAGSIVLSPAAIEVIDPDTLEIVGGTVPDDPGDPGELLDAAGLAFGGLALHPSGRIGAIGSAAGRRVYVVDLEPLEALTTPGDLLAEPLAVVALEVPRAGDGPPEATCSGFTGGTAFSDDGGTLFVTERCDGTLTRFSVTLPAAGAPVEASHFALIARERLLAPLVPESLGDVRDPGVLRVRDGRPGVDYGGPDLFFLASQPNAQVCALRVDSL